LKDEDPWGIYWIGLTDQAREGDFVWDSTKMKVTYTNWRDGEPNSLVEEEDCVHLDYLTLERTWNDYNCSATDAFALCQLSKKYTFLKQVAKSSRRYHNVNGFTKLISVNADVQNISSKLAM
jgi:hypothetical protein